jgi:GxxExxY protein
VDYKEVHLGNQRIDFMIEDVIILELKSVSEINNIHMAQLLSYLKSSNKKLGLILNFAKATLDIKRVVNKF